ncbi:hypothetical protein ABI59_00065 [Acidobacteria bacterium Mor1]|nr:hypothetical protein ABI59_00065 [Acidobacteria bacterium Mor1]
MRVTGHVVRLAASALLVLLASTPGAAVEPGMLRPEPAALPAGSSDHVAVSRLGRLFVGPKLTELASTQTDSAPAHVWSLAAGTDGRTYLGTGPDGLLLKVQSSGRREVLFRAQEPMITALVLMPGGDLLAAASPGGKIYRVRPTGSAELWCETGERYVWALVRHGGKVYAATGENGRLFEIRDDGDAVLVFDSDEAHLTALAGSGNDLYAGGSGRGLVYKIDAEGHSQVLHDDPLPQVTGIAPSGDGSVLIATQGIPAGEPRRPAVRIQLPAGGDGLASSDTVELESDSPILRGVIEGLPSPEAEPAGQRGRVLRVTADGTSRELWSSTTEAPFAVAVDGAGRGLFGTGEPARLYRVEAGDEDITLLATLREGQLARLQATPGGVTLATSNPAAIYRAGNRPADYGVYLSTPLDAGSTVRWGSVRWESESEPGRAELYTRSGNSAVPDETWSAWSPAMILPGGAPIPNPDGRYLQWRARLFGGESSAAAISDVAVSYLPRNRRPRVRDLSLAGPGATSGEATFTWRWNDPDGDGVEATLQARRDGEQWRDVARENFDGGAAAPSWREGTLRWDTSGETTGRYALRLQLSDDISNHPGEGLEAGNGPIRHLIVDRDPPTLEVGTAGGGTVELRARDAHSAIRRLEYVVDGKALFRLRPRDGVCDSRNEVFDFPEARRVAGGMLRVVDMAGNISEQSL